MNTVKRNCIYCSKEFDVPVKRVNQGQGKFCSRTCKSRYQALQTPKPEPNCTCATCGKNFYRNKSKQANSKSGIQFCSKECKGQAQRIGTQIPAILPDHYGKSTAYRKVALRHFENKCSSCGYDRHPEILQVHHKDCDRTNNSLDNLCILCPNCHEELHFLAKTGKYFGPRPGD